MILKMGFLVNNKSRAASNAMAKTTNQENSIAGIFVAELSCEFGLVGGLYISII